MIQTLLYSAAFLWFIGSLWKPGDSFKLGLTAIDKGFVLTGLTIGLSIAISSMPFYSLMTGIRFGAVLIFYAIVRQWVGTESSQRALLWLFLVAALFYSLYGLLQLNGFFPKDYWYETNSLASRYVNSGHFACFLVMPFFAALILFVLSRTLLLRVLFFCLLLFIGTVMILTKSRTVWISLAVGVFVFLFFLNAVRPFSRRFYLCLFIAWVAVMTGAFFSGIIEAILDRFSELKSLNFFSIHHRLHFWQGAILAMIARPWGWGLGTFVHIFPQFRVHTDRFIVDYAHNEVLQIGVDLGLVGICLFVGLLFLYLKLSWKAIRASDRSHSDKVKMAGITACLVTLVIASQFDFPLRIYATAFYAAALLGMQSVLMRDTVYAARETLHRRDPAAILFYKKKLILGALIVMGLGLSGTYLYAESCYQQGRHFEKNFDWDLAMNQYNRASRFAPWASEYDEAGGRLAEKRAALMMVPAERQRWLETAFEFYSSASKKNKFWPASFFKMAVISGELGDEAKAEEYLRAAHERDPRNPLFTFEYGLQKLKTGRLDEGMALLEAFVKGGYYDPVPLTQTQILGKVFPYVADAEKLRRILLEGPYALHDLGYFLIQNGKEEDGSIILHEASQMIRGQSGYFFYLEHFGILDAQAYSRAGMYREAAAIYEEAIKQSPNAASYQLYLDELLKEMNER